MVLLLLPTSTNKLLAKWQGPYRVSKRMGNVVYLIETPNRCRKRGIYHVNLLKKWETADSFCALASEVVDEEIPDWRSSESSQSTLGRQLSQIEKADMCNILEEFKDVMQDKPGQSTLMELQFTQDLLEQLDLQHIAFHIPYREAVAMELEKMEKNGIIEPSISEWSSPIENKTLGRARDPRANGAWLNKLTE